MICNVSRGVWFAVLNNVMRFMLTFFTPPFSLPPVLHAVPFPAPQSYPFLSTFNGVSFTGKPRKRVHENVQSSNWRWLFWRARDDAHRAAPSPQVPASAPEGKGVHQQRLDEGKGKVRTE